MSVGVEGGGGPPAGRSWWMGGGGSLHSSHPGDLHLIYEYLNIVAITGSYIKVNTRFLY